MDEEGARCAGVLRRFERHPVRLRLHPAADDVDDRLRSHAECHEREERDGHRLSLAERAAPARRQRDQERAGHGEECVPADALPDVLARVVRDLVGQHHADLVVGEASVEQRVPDEDLPRSVHPGGERVRRVGVLADLFDANGNRLRALVARVFAGGSEQRRVMQWAVGGDEPRKGEREEHVERDERRRARDPPAVAQHLREAHHDQQREADEPELAAQAEPVREQPLEIADVVGGLVASRPPEFHEPERDLRDPQDPEPEHPEQHPGADPAGRGFLREAMSPPRVEAQHGEHDEHRCE